ncbi:LysR family transcriptional regulator [Rhodobacteraceae bacterium RKSG542]|nr:LysR family transcriptional regulator [Pseudovibrio flavus]
MNVSLKQLKVFRAISQEGSITAAAELLNLTKPAVSMALAEMERQLGRRLFDRFNKRLLMNEQGHLLLPLADELLERAEAIGHLFAEDGGARGTLKIGSSYTVGNNLTPFLIGDFRRSTGHMSQELEISNTRDVVDALLSFQLDIGLVEGFVSAKELICEDWREDEMVIICAKDDPLASRAPIPVSALSKRDWVLREEGSGTREFFASHITKSLTGWTLAFELNSPVAIINSVSAGLGLSCLSRLAVKDALARGDVCEVSLKQPLTRRFSLLVHRDKYQSPIAKEFFEFAKNWEY